MILVSFQFFKEKVVDTISFLLIKRACMHSFKARISSSDENIKPRKELYKIYWVDGIFEGEYWA
tara:strand:+ start:549 stop:740 length:192 start_codon:yes stop_codon:yes gene_type:complete